MDWILASGSPRRKDLLARLNHPFQVVPSDADELDDSSHGPEYLVRENAWRKTRQVAENFPNSLVIGSDTTVAYEQTILNKPGDMEHAREMLRFLSGKTHSVLTAVCLKQADWELDFIEVSKVTFRKLSDDLIEKYLQETEPLDKAGSYAIQERGEWIIDSFDGSLENVIGLPLDRLREELIANGFLSEQSE